jgi:hypothetical protein
MPWLVFIVILSISSILVFLAARRMQSRDF